MSVAAPPKPPASTVSQADRLIEERVEEACRALWWAELTRAFLGIVLAGFVLVFLWLVVDQWVYSPGPLGRSTLLLASLAGLVWCIWFRVVPLIKSSVRPEYAARSLENDMPELRQALTSYITLRSERQATGLRSRVVRSIAAQTAGRLQARDELPDEATGTLRWWLATAAAFALLAGYVVFSPKNSLQTAARLAAPLASIEPARRVSIQDVKPGNVEAVAGREVAVSARVAGLSDGEEVFCRWELPLGQDAGEREVVMEPDEELGRYGGSIGLPHSASGVVNYFVTAGDATVGPFQLRVEDLPVVALQSVTYQPPAYTKQSPHTNGSGAITALDGTRVTILATTNRAVAKAKIEFNPKVLGDTVQATAGATDVQIDAAGTTLSVAFTLRSSRGRSAAVELESYRMVVADEAGQQNSEPIIYPIRVVTDLPPEVAIMLPVVSPKDLPIDLQQSIEVHASDPDFGLSRVALEIRSGIDLIAEPVLWSEAETTSGKGNRVSEYGFRPAELGLRIGDTVQIVAVATDNRSIPNVPGMEPNVSKTDPIELRIVAGDEQPSADADPDGVGEPEEENSSKKQEESGNEHGGSGDKNSGQGGGSGGDSSKGEAESGQEGGSGSGEKQSGEKNSGDESNPSGGEGESDGGGSKESKGTDGGDASSSNANESESSEATDSKMSDDSRGSPSDANAKASSADSEAGKETAEGDPAATSEPQEGMSEAEGSGAGSSNENQNAGASERSDTGEDGGTGSDEAGAGDASEQETSGQGGSENSGSPKGEPGSGAGKGQRGEEEGGEQGTPQHDGETFERIRDYLEQKQKEQAGGAGSKEQNPASDDQEGSDSQGSKSNSSESGDPQNPESQGAGTSDASDQNTGTEDTSTEGQSSKQQDQETGKQGKPSGKEAGEGNDAEGDAGGKEEGASDQSSAEAANKSESEGSSESESSGAGGNAASKAGSPESEGQNSEAEQGTGKPSLDGKQTADASADPSNSDATASQIESFDGNGAGSDGPEADNAPLPPQPANLDYAKKATDLVLDYLEETRDAPDRELLDKLNLSEEDLKRFADRWQKIRDVPPTTDMRTSPDIKDALESLGLQPPRGDGNSRIRESADDLRAIRDAGNRKQPPAAFRDAFDAFRRAMGKQ